jgi:GTP-binding protein HflX
MRTDARSAWGGPLRAEDMTMKFHSKPVEEHAEVPLADDGRWEGIVAHWSRREGPRRGPVPSGNACYVLSVHRQGDRGHPSAQLAEINSLVQSQGDRVVGAEAHELHRPDPRTLIRRGVAERVGNHARDRGADLLVIDAELSPSQTRNLEDATGLPVADREAVILNVFERHATTPRARTQVQLAHLEYLRPRIRGIGLDMDQQAGGVMGNRGSGDTASELLARRLDDRLVELRRRLERINTADSERRRRRTTAFRVALAGYTNAGKTSLMNALCDAGLSARDRPFETLDTTTRSLTRHGGDVLLSDTVGFIRRLPDRLFASFESTLAEISEASFLLVVVDASDPERDEHLSLTTAVLERLGAARLPRLVVFNKIDRLGAVPLAADLARLAGNGEHLCVSARDGAAMEALRRAILAAARARHAVRELFVPYERGELSGRIHAQCRVLRTHSTARGTQFLIEGPPALVEQLAQACRKRTP